MSPDDYTQFHPGTAVSNAAERYRDAIANKRKRRPVFTVSPEQQARNAAAQELRCPNGFGNTPKTLNHWIPAITTECVRCGQPNDAILYDNDQEPTP